MGNGYVTQDIQGRVPGTQIYYSIQGNILRPGEVVPNAVKAFLNTNGALTDRVLERAIAVRARVAVLPCCHHLADAAGNGAPDQTLRQD